VTPPGASEGLNPLGSIWFHPRRTIRAIVDTDPFYGVLLLAMAAGAANAIMEVAALPGPAPIGSSIFAAGLLAGSAGAVLGIAWLYIFGWLYRWVGGWLGGRAKTQEVRAAIAWVEVPTLALFLLWLIGYLWAPDPEAAAGGSGELIRLVGIVFLSLLAVVVWVWRTVLACQTLAEVHRFSAWKGLGTLVIPQLVLLTPVLLFGMLAAVAVPTIVAGRTSADEAAASGNLWALASSLELYRSVHGGYPADWGRLYATGPQPAFGPPSFRTSGALQDHPAGGYRYSYAAVGRSDYVLDAVPELPGTSGQRSFYKDASPVLRHCLAESPGERAGPSDAAVEDPPGPCRPAAQPLRLLETE